MAGGGAVQSRDRIPALLEPGEFVMRRPAAKAIGGAALNQMNATGKNLTPPNIQVNLNNEGAPKNVQAQPARVQGDKIIIDMGKVVSDEKGTGKGADPLNKNAKKTHLTETKKPIKLRRKKNIILKHPVYSFFKRLMDFEKKTSILRKGFSSGKCTFM